MITYKCQESVLNEVKRVRGAIDSTIAHAHVRVHSIDNWNKMTMTLVFKSSLFACKIVKAFVLTK